MSTSDGAVQLAPSYQESHLPLVTVQPVSANCTGTVDSAIKTSCRVSQPSLSASTQCWKRLRS